MKFSKGVGMEEELGGGFQRRCWTWIVGARGELRGDALMIGTRGTYRAIFEEIKRIPKPQVDRAG